MHCQCCGAEMDSKIEERHIKDQKQGEVTLKVHAVYADNKEGLIREAVIGFWRWKAEGCKEYGYDCEEQQGYYDLYHRFIDYDEKTGIYSYNIQTYDSPCGDTWMEGKFRMNGKNIEMIEGGKITCTQT